MSQSETSSSARLNATRLRALLGKADLSEKAAATVLDVDEADIRAYVSAEKPVPRHVILALERILDMRGMVAEKWLVDAPERSKALAPGTRVGQHTRL